MKKIRVLFVSHSADLGGAEIVLWDVMASLDPQRYEPFLVVPRSGPLEDKARRAALPVFRAAYRPWLTKKRFTWRHIYHGLLNAAGLPGFIRLVKQIEPDLIFTNTCTVLSGALAGRLCSRPHVWYIHETISGEPEAFRFWAGNKLAFRIIRRTGLRILSDSDYVRSTFPERMQSAVTTVYYGFSIPPDRGGDQRKPSRRNAAAIGPDETIITVVGVVCERKGQFEAAKAMPGLLREIPSARLLFVGETYPRDAGYRRAIEEYVSGHGLEGKVRFLGFLEDPGEVYDMSHCVLVPSKVEPFGRIVVEAMLRGVPVVAARVGGIPEIIRDGETGTLFSSWEAEAIARAVQTALGRPDLALMTEKARLEARERFSMAAMTRKIDEILAGSAGRAL